MQTVRSLFDILVKSGASLYDSDKYGFSCDQAFGMLGQKTDNRCQALLLHMLRVGAGLRMLATFSDAFSRCVQLQTNIGLFKAAVILTGFRPDPTYLNKWLWQDDTQEILAWYKDERKSPPNLKRQCRVVIRSQLAKANGYTNLEPFVPADEPLTGSPTDIHGLYLMYDGPANE